MAGFWNSLVNKIAGVDNNDYYEGDDGIYEDEYQDENLDGIHVEESDYTDLEPLPIPEMNNRIVPIKSVQATDTQVVILQPDSIRSSQQVCDHIRAGHTVICNIENVERSVAQRVIDYIEKYMRNWPPEMICPKLDALIDRAEPAEEVQKWLIYKLTDYYLQSNVMVYDEVYVHLVQRYFATGKAPWFSPSMIDEQIERANKWEHLLVGRESPELILFDTNHYAYSLHRMKGDYTILIFWSPTCGHCREIIPAVYKVFEEYQDSLNMTAFAILSEPDEATIVKWKKFLADHKMTSHKWVNLNGGEANVDWREVYDITTTPQIYMIENKNHTFIAKKLNAQILREICKSLTKQSQQ